MPELINTETNLPEELSAEAAGQAFTSGTHALHADKSQILVSPEGELQEVPANEVHPSITKGGYRFADQAEVKEVQNEKKYGQGTTNSLKAFAEGAARSATLGGYDIAAPHLGITTPEAIKERKERHPVAEIGGEVAGLFVPGPTPVKGVSLLGRATERGVGKALAERQAGKVLQTLVPSAVGSGVEGALFGVGQVASEAALGDPDLTAERAATQIGLSSLFGGGLGVVGKGVSEGVQHFVPDGIRAPGATRSFLEGLQELKHNAPEIESAAKEIGAPLLESQVSASKHVQELDSVLLNSPLTPATYERQRLLKEGLDKSEAAVSEALGKGSELTLAQTGDALKKSLAEKIQSQAKPVEDLYAALKQQGEVPLAAKAVQDVGKEIETLEGVHKAPRSASARLARNVSKDLENLTSVEDIRTYRKNLTREFNPETKFIKGRILEKLDGLEEASVLKAAESAPEAQKAGLLQLLETHSQAKKAYGTFKGKLEELGAALGKKKIHGKQDFLDFIDDLAPEKLASRLFTKNDSKFLQFFAKEFPEETQSLMNYQRSQVLAHSVSDGSLDPKKALKAINKLSPEVREIMFSPDSIKKLKAADTYLESLPKNINPSGTSKAEAWRRFFEHPLSSVFQASRDVAAVAAIKQLVKIGDASAAKSMATLISLEKMAQKTQAAMTRGIKNVLKHKDTISGFTGATGAKFVSRGTQSKEERVKQYRKQIGIIAQLQTDPDSLTQRLEESTAHIYPHAPNIAAGFQNTAAVGLGFLASKVPPVPDRKAFSPEWVPNQTEISKFERYYDTVEDPLMVLEQMARGTLTEEHVEAIGTVYPKLYADITQQFMDQIADKGPENIPYKAKLMLSLFMQQDVDDSVTQAAIMANQQTINGPSKQQDNQGMGAPKQQRSTQGGLGKITISQRSLTAQQASAQRT